MALVGFPTKFGVLIILSHRDTNWLKTDQNDPHNSGHNRRESDSPWRETPLQIGGLTPN